MSEFNNLQDPHEPDPAAKQPPDFPGMNTPPPHAPQPPPVYNSPPQPPPSPGASFPPNQPQNPTYTGAPPPLTYQSSGPPPVAPAPEKTRRVGSFSMALGLITIGTLLLLRLLIPSIDYTIITRFSPLLLIFLGLEIILVNIFSKGYKIKYDFLSVLFSLLLIVGSITAAIVPDIIHREVDGERVNSRLSSELNNASQKILGESGLFKTPTLDCYVNVKPGEFKNDMTLSDIKPEHYVQIRLSFNDTFESKEAFATACHKAAALLSNTVPRIDYASFYSVNRQLYGYQGDTQYTLVTENSYQFTAPLEQIISLAQIEYWVPDHQNYVSEWEYKNLTEPPTAYANSDTSELPDASIPEPPDDPESIPDEIPDPSSVESIPVAA